MEVFLCGPVMKCSYCAHVLTTSISLGETEPASTGIICPVLSLAAATAARSGVC